MMIVPSRFHQNIFNEISRSLRTSADNILEVEANNTVGMLFIRAHSVVFSWLTIMWLLIFLFSNHTVLMCV